VTVDFRGSLWRSFGNGLGVYRTPGNSRGTLIPKMGFLSGQKNSFPRLVTSDSGRCASKSQFYCPGSCDYLEVFRVASAGISASSMCSVFILINVVELKEYIFSLAPPFSLHFCIYQEFSNSASSKISVP